MKDMGMTPRMTPKEHHDLVVNNLPANRKEICKTWQFDEVVVYNRKRQCLSKISHKQPYEILQDVLHGAWSKDELENYVEVYEETRRLKEKRNVNDIETFVSEYGALYDQAKEKSEEHEKKSLIGKVWSDIELENVAEELKSTLTEVRELLK